MRINSIQAIEILDSRGNPTIRTFIRLEDESLHSSSVPSGASTGSHEAVELRDKDEKRYFGLGVQKAMNNVNTFLNDALKNMDVTKPNEIDKKMLEIDGTENKSNIGANAILSVSQAVVKAAAYSQKVPLWDFINQYYMKGTPPAFPHLMVNVINGGKHAQWNFDIQEFMVLTTSNIPSQSVRVASEIFHQLGKNIKARKLSTLVGDEGGYSPALNSNDEAFEVILESASQISYENGKEFNLGIDAAASEFYKDSKYILKKNNKEITAKELIEYYLTLKDKYNVYSFEDAFFEDDWDSFKEFNAKVGSDSLVVGDDFLVTNPARIKQGIETNSANAVIIKPNQIGSVMETAEAVALSKKAGWKVAVAHRSGETEDSFIADLSFGMAADYIKTGSMSRSDRLAKYNRLIEIENKL